MRAIRKVTSSEVLTKQAIRKKIIIHKNIYILKPLLNVVTARIMAFVLSQNKFLFACVKEACLLWAQPCFDTFHYLIIVEALWS
jgi:hypothetical protein